MRAPRRVQRLVALAALVTLLAPPAAGAAVPAPGVSGFEVASLDLPGAPAPFAPRMPVSSFALESPLVAESEGGLIAQRGMGQSPRRRPRRAKADSSATDSLAPEPPRRERSAGHRALPIALSPERARVMLQSLTLPGWGQATLGQKRAASLFTLIEAGVWGSFAAFRIQERMRRETYERTAHLYAGIDLSSRDEEFRRIVGFYLSSDEYNRLVVRRDAANLYYGDPAAYNAYVAEHELKGADAWSWDSLESLLRYARERQSTQRSAQRATTAISVAVINRLLSVVHVSRGAGPSATGRTSWKLECVPAGDDPSAYRLGVRADF